MMEAGEEYRPQAEDVRVLLRCRERYGEEFPLMVFPTKDGRPWLLLQAKALELIASFPSINVWAECLAAYAWIVANPQRQKTHRGMSAYLTNWMLRSGGRQ